MSTRRRHRPVHQSTGPAIWLGRLSCVVAIVAVVVLGMWQPRTQPVVPAELGVCDALRVVAATALYDRLPPLGSSPEQEEAVRMLNTELASMRTQIAEACR